MKRRENDSTGHVLGLFKPTGLGLISLVDTMSCYAYAFQPTATWYKVKADIEVETVITSHVRHFT